MKEAPRNANVKVMSDYAVVMSIGKEVFNPFLEREPGFRRFIGPCLLDVCRSGAEAGSKSFDFHIFWCHSRRVWCAVVWCR